MGEGSTIADKTTIKNCIIGSNCQIHEKVRLTNCIIMDNVTIRSLNNINGSILSDGVESCEKCELKDCIVSKGHSFNKDGGKLNFNSIYVWNYIGSYLHITGAPFRWGSNPLKIRDILELNSHFTSLKGPD